MHNSPTTAGVAANNAHLASRLQGAVNECSTAESVVNITRMNIDKACILKETCSTLRDKVLGSRPCDPKAPGPQAVPQGLLNVLESEGENLARILDDVAGIIAELNRAI